MADLSANTGLSAETIDAVEAADSWAATRNALRAVAGLRGEWAGLPMPIDGTRLHVEPSYPFAPIFEGGAAADPADDDIKVINRFWSSARSSDVVIFEQAGKRDWGLLHGANHLGHALSTLGAAVAWGVEQEARAVQLLGTLLRHHMFKTYLLTGMFLETSRRSGVTYLFRRLRPTVAITMRSGRTFRHHADESPRVLAALCLHPIAYYEGSWAGAMCPTDDVIAHLMLMRGDERLFWSRANQHPGWRPEAGI